MNAFQEDRASAYDREFAYSRVALAQQGEVWDYMAPLLNTPSMEVLELNCDAGMDTVRMARAGHRVLATDPSSELLRTARGTVRQHGLEDRVVHEVLTFDRLVERPWNARFHLVFSGAGGLNHLEGGALATLCDPIAGALVAKGRFIAVVQPDRCLSETLHSLLQGRWREAFRRGRHEPAWAGLSGSGVHTWYHRPQTMIEAFQSRFRVVNLRPIGFFVPPMHRSTTLNDPHAALHRAVRWDARIAQWHWLARYSDHYLIDLERRA